MKKITPSARAYAEFDSRGCEQYDMFQKLIENSGKVMIHCVSLIFCTIFTSSIALNPHKILDTHLPLDCMLLEKYQIIIVTIYYKYYWNGSNMSH